MGARAQWSVDLITSDGAAAPRAGGPHQPLSGRNVTPGECRSLTNGQIFPAQGVLIPLLAAPSTQLEGLD